MNEKWERLNRLTEEAVKRQKALQEKLEGLSSSDRGIQGGELYLFPVDLEIAMTVAALFSHPDDKKLWFGVPVDDFPLAGPVDLVVKEQGGRAPQVLRCNFGMWLKEEDLKKARLVGLLEEERIFDARRLLQAMVRGNLVVSEEAAEIEESEGYEEWEGQLEDAREELLRWLERQAVVVDLSAFRKSKETSAPLAFGEEERLAAASDSLSARLEEIEAGEETVEIAIDGWSGPGRLSLQIDEEEVSLVLRDWTEEPPVVRVQIESGEEEERPLSWTAAPGGSVWLSEATALSAVRSFLVESEDGWQEIQLLK